MGRSGIVERLCKFARDHKSASIRTPIVRLLAKTASALRRRRLPKVNALRALAPARLGPRLPLRNFASLRTHRTSVPTALTICILLNFSTRHQLISALLAFSARDFLSRLRVFAHGGTEARRFFGRLRNGRPTSKHPSVAPFLRAQNLWEGVELLSGCANLRVNINRRRKDAFLAGRGLSASAFGASG